MPKLDEAMAGHLFRMWQRGYTPRVAVSTTKARFNVRLTWEQVHALWVDFSWRYS